MMVYKEIIEFVVASGKRIAKLGGKRYLTEEDINIEKGLKEIIKKHYPEHGFYAEEENDSFSDCDDVWIADPISGTNRFIKGLNDYAIVIAHWQKGLVKFGVVYAPLLGELYTAERGKGAFLNGIRINVKSNLKIALHISYAWKDIEYADRIKDKISIYNKLTCSHALSICHTARGDYGGYIALGKDSFPYFAGSIILQEAGGYFSNNEGKPIKHTDRVFIGGNKEMYDKIMNAVNS